MLTDQVEKETGFLEPSSSPAENPTGSGDGAASARNAALGLALYSAGSAWNSISTAFRLSYKLGGFIFSPVKRVFNSPPLKPVRNQFEKLVARGEAEVDVWIRTGLSAEPRAREAAQNFIDPLVEGVVSYLSTHPAIENLVKDQIEQLAKQSPDLPQINILVRVLADNYITYLNENPEQVKQLIRSQGDDYINHLSENPIQVQELVKGQSVSMISEVTDEVRERLVTGDSVLEALARRLFRRPPSYELPEPPPEIKARALQARLPGDFPRLEAMRHDE